MNNHLMFQKEIGNYGQSKSPDSCINAVCHRGTHSRKEAGLYPVFPGSLHGHGSYCPHRYTKEQSNQNPFQKQAHTTSLQFSSANDPCLFRIYLIFFNNQLINTVCPDYSAGWVHHTVNFPGYFRIYRRILKSKGSIDKLAVFHHQVINVAHPLEALDGAVYKCQVLCIPAQVFTGDKRIIYCHILRVPESIL